MNFLEDNVERSAVQANAERSAVRGEGVEALDFAAVRSAGSCRRRGREAQAAPRFAVLTLTWRSCRWPFGHPGDADFRFCGAARLPRGPYCEEHARRARTTE